MDASREATDDGTGCAPLLAVDLSVELLLQLQHAPVLGQELALDGQLLSFDLVRGGQVRPATRDTGTAGPTLASLATVVCGRLQSVPPRAVVEPTLAPAIHPRTCPQSGPAPASAPCQDQGGWEAKGGREAKSGGWKVEGEAKGALGVAQATFEVGLSDVSALTLVVEGALELVLAPHRVVARVSQVVEL
jgi:hypothetical protein